MLTRRSFTILGLTGLAIPACSDKDAPAVISSVGSDYNEYARHAVFEQNVRREVVASRENWSSFFPGNELAGKHFNRQNIALEPGQTVLVPHRSITMESISPFPSSWSGRGGYSVVIHQKKYAWALYHDSILVRWGAAVCGHDGRTPNGAFTITEVAGPKRRSNRYPVIEAAEGRGALMPYYMRLTSSGVGMHARYIRGRHETKGCIGMFYDDAKWLNLTIASQNRLKVFIST